MVNLRSLSDELVVLRDWDEDDADWYAAAVRDPEIQRFTTEREDLAAAQVRAAIAERAGYRRARQHDGTRTVKGQPWPVVGYALRVPHTTAR